MTLDFDFDRDRIVKSAERVRQLAEVFTPNTTVQEMLDLLPSKVWEPHPSHSFLEPACGDGNFLKAILDRKLERIWETLEALDHHAAEELGVNLGLEALASIYAVDISKENVIGETPGHEVGARMRLVNKFIDWMDFALGRKLLPDSAEVESANWIVAHNIIIGNMLPVDASGKATGRDLIPIIEYEFSPHAGKVLLRKTTLGEILFSAQQDQTETPSLFAPEPPTEFWSGAILDIAIADRVSAPKLRGPARNGISK